MDDSQTMDSPSREDRLMAALAYPFWFVIFPLVYMTPDKRNDPFLRFHIFQGGLIGLGGVVGLSCARAVLCIFVRWFILFDVFLYPVLRVAEWLIFGMAAYGFVLALLGKRAAVPVLSKFVSSLSSKKSFREKADDGPEDS